MVRGATLVPEFFLNFAACVQRLAFLRCTEVMITWLCLRPAALSMACCLQKQLAV